MSAEINLLKFETDPSKLQRYGMKASELPVLNVNIG